MTDDMEDKKFKLGYYLIFLIIPLSSIFYYIKYIDSADRAIGFLLYVAVSFIFMALLWKIVSAVNSRFDLKKLSVISVTAVGLAAADQLIKLVLSKTGFETKVIGKFFMIKQRHNIYQNGIFNFLKIESSLTSMIIFKAVILALVICLYKLFKSDTAKKAYVLLAAAAASHLLDSILYGYTLDYIYFYKVMTYDLKDYYIDAGISLIILLMLINEIKKSKEKKKVN